MARLPSVGMRGVLCGIAVAAVVAATGAAAAPAPAPVYAYEVVRVRPHDVTAFTEGLDYDNGNLVESGILGRKSSVWIARLNGQRVRRADLSGHYSAEGVTVLAGRVYQLTWMQGMAFVYDARTLRPLKTFRYRGEGWGIANDGKRLIMSDGSDRLQFRDRRTFALLATVRVRDGEQPISGLNELELVGDAVCANVFPSDRIACIETKTGLVRYWIDLAGILPPELRADENAVPNGIAYDEKGKRLFVTGKLWPRLFQIKLHPARR